MPICLGCKEIILVFLLPYQAPVFSNASVAVHASEQPESAKTHEGRCFSLRVVILVNELLFTLCYISEAEPTCVDTSRHPIAHLQFAERGEAGGLFSVGKLTEFHFLR